MEVKKRCRLVAIGLGVFLGILFHSWFTGNCSGEEASKASLSIMIAAQSADTLTTFVALHSSPANYEANPFLPKGRNGIVIVKSLTIPATAYLVHKVGKKRPTLAKVIALGIASASGLAAVHNARRTK